MTIKSKNPGIYQTLIAQADKIFRHNRQGSFRTKKRCYEAMKRFCHFLAERYAARTYQELIDGGVSPFNASLRVSQLLGHERPDVTNVYLASVKDGAAHD